MSVFDDQLAAGRNVFGPLEALQEHIGGAWLALYREGRLTAAQYDAPADQVYPLGSPEYHLAATQRAAQQVFQLLAAMLPALYAADEAHQPAAAIIARIRAAARIDE